MNIGERCYYIHKRLSEYCLLYTRIFLYGIMITSSTLSQTNLPGPYYTLTVYEKSMPYDSAVVECNEHQSRLVVADDSKKEKIHDYINTQRKGSGAYYWLQGKGETCMAYFESGVGTKKCHESHFYVCEQVQAHSIKLTKYGEMIQEETEITCNALGYPIPSIVWTRKDSEISISEGESIHQTINSGESTLHLKDLKVIDEGEYKCHANNSYAGKTYTLSEVADIKVPSTPIIKSVTQNSCNSRLVIEWKPHPRAIGLKHKLTLRQTASSERTVIYRIPARDVLQTTSISMSPQNQYEITIQPCSGIDECYSYVASMISMTDDIPSHELNAALRKEDGICAVFWSPSHGTWADAIIRYQIRIESSFAYATLDATEKLNDIVTSVNFPVSSYLIPKLPNRNYTVYVQAETCAGLGEATMASGKCVTDASAPTYLPQPQLQDGTFHVENGTLEIHFPLPDETNGLISCVFVIVHSQYQTENGNAESMMQELNAETSTSSFGYIAFAMKRDDLQDHISRQNDAILLFKLGDESKTECDIRNVEANALQAIHNNLTEKFKGHNKRLKKGEQYQIQVITSTPSGSKVLFQASKTLNLNEPPAQSVDSSQITLISVGVLIVIAAVLLALYAFYIRQSKNWKFKDTPLPNENSRSPAEPEIPAACNGTENIAKHTNNETTYNKIENPEIAKPTQPTIAIPCKKADETEPDDPYENYVSETTVDMSALEQYFKKHTERNNELFFQQYQNIKTMSRENMKSTEVASHPDLKKKNRYKNILPCKLYFSKELKAQ